MERHHDFDFGLYSSMEMLCDAASAPSELGHSRQVSYQHNDRETFNKGPQAQSVGRPTQGDNRDRSRTAVENDSSTPQSSDPDRSAKSLPECHICHRKYERNDHLNRHLQSHENTRPFHCTEDGCLKRFNRADLLARHVAMHKRHNSKPASQRHNMIRRTDRAAAACDSCVTSKAKCRDEKPCARCCEQGIICQTTRLQSAEKSNSDKSDMSNSVSYVSALPNNPHTFHRPVEQNHVQPHPKTHEEASSGQVMSIAAESAHASTLTSNYTSSFAANSTFAFAGQMAPTPRYNGVFNADLLDATDDQALHSNIMSDMSSFPNGWGFANHDLDFNFWDLPTEDLRIHNYQANPSVTSGPSTNLQSETTQPLQHVARGFAAFKRSPWLWTPAQKDNNAVDQQDLALDKQQLSTSLTPSSALGAGDIDGAPFLDVDSRDRMYALTVSTNRTGRPVPGFPSLDILNHLLQVYFLRESYQVDNWIHLATFKATDCHPQFLIALVSAGSTLISVPSIWKMGLALQEIARITTGQYWENNNAGTRDLQLAEAFLLCLEIGTWSGYGRKTEIAESFGQPVVTMLRRSGFFASPQEPASCIPCHEDKGDILYAKWKKWIKRESFKRVALHLFLHCTKTSLSFQTPPLLLLSELTFTLPASRDLWLAKDANEWKEKYLAQCSMASWTNFKIIDLLYNYTLLEAIHEEVDADLCCKVLLYSFWGQVWSLRESRKVYTGGKNSSTTSKGLWVNIQQTEIRDELENFVVQLTKLRRQTFETVLVKELFLIILHISPDELQRFAGSAGEEEANRSSAILEEWATTEDARRAVWHSGQVLAAAKQFPPAELRGFYAIAIYLAALTLWVYSYMSSRNGSAAARSSATDASNFQAVLNGPETRETRLFLSLGQGLPGLSNSSVHNEGEGFFELSHDPNVVFDTAREILRANFPILKEPLPSLVENLIKLMRGISTRLDSRRSTSEER